MCHFVERDMQDHWPELHREDLEHQLSGDVSIVLNGMQHRSKAVASLAILLERALKLKVSVNMYHTPAAGQAFALHYDATEVIVIQLGGFPRSYFMYMLTRPWA
jgi:hypothetical protein